MSRNTVAGGLQSMRLKVGLENSGEKDNGKGNATETKSVSFDGMFAYSTASCFFVTVKRSLLWLVLFRMCLPLSTRLDKFILLKKRKVKCKLFVGVGVQNENESAEKMKGQREMCSASCRMGVYRCGWEVITIQRGW